MAELLSDEDIERGLGGLHGWRREGDAIARDLELRDFAEAMAFVNEVADVAEERNHHPDILVHGYNNVRLTLSTHSEGGVTEADHALADAIDEL
jgi:4a-hydroxytetrahydrobiopterin dehydratase